MRCPCCGWAPTPKKRGPAPIITPGLAAAIEALLEQGLTVALACRKNGVSRETWYRWLRSQPKKETA